MEVRSKFTVAILSAVITFGTLMAILGPRHCSAHYRHGNAIAQGCHKDVGSKCGHANNKNWHNDGHKSTQKNIAPKTISDSLNQSNQSLK